MGISPGVAFARKKSAPGFWQRITALSSIVDAAAALATAPERVRSEDALDALAAAWSARRWTAGCAEMLGGKLDYYADRCGSLCDPSGGLRRAQCALPWYRGIDQEAGGQVDDAGAAR